MKAKYLSRAQAFAMCHDYQHLLGAPMTDDHNVNLILAAPYSRILQWQYMQDILDNDSNPDAIPPDNPAGRYEVLLLSRAAVPGRGFIAKDLRSYLAERSIPFPESRYACLRSNSISMSVLEQILG